MKGKHSISVEVINTNNDKKDDVYTNSMVELISNEVINSVNKCLSEHDKDIDRCGIEVTVKKDGEIYERK